ncbi:protein yellow-like [Cylas formicarius]|uniref:protein yellow-like n=1 Tax=Cylas formicarius TaxID=197179 RepID=UPI002958AABE|nr:protein yellow-like [Cylas formicarius]
MYDTLFAHRHYTMKIIYLITYVALANGVEKFEVFRQWTLLNYTWRSQAEYKDALKTRRYVPQNNAPAGIKIYRNILYASVPKFREGVPVTLTTVENKPFNPLLTPFPSWELNDDSDCGNLQNVQSMEIDTKGTMWVLDGARINNYTRCPTKLVLLDLNNVGKVIRVKVFPNEVSLKVGGFLNDLVVDETSGGFAYITDASPVDPGLIVYSKEKNEAWKLRDSSMFSGKTDPQLFIKGSVVDSSYPIDGIALSPPRDDRIVYYCSVGSDVLYSIPTSVLKNQQLANTGEWRKNITAVGRKLGQSDGITIDSDGDLFYTLPTFYGVGKWNTSTPLWTSELFDRDEQQMVWTDGFAFDQRGYIYLITNYMYKFIQPKETLFHDGRVLFRVFRYHTGTKSYLYDK